MRYIYKVYFFPAIISFFTLSLFGNGIKDDDHIKCPPDITISCCQDYNDTKITGHPGIINYVFNNYTYSDSVGINECRVGKIKRIWTGYNEVGHFSCIQYIKLERSNIFAGLINWPNDWSGTCEDIIPYSEPDYDVGFCDQIAHTFKDDTFRFDQTACIKILRNWKVLDWCVYKPNSGTSEGIYSHTQVLMIVDKIAPKIEHCKDRIVKALNSDCSADVVFTQNATDNNCGHNSNLKWIYEIDINNNCGIDSTLTIYSNNPAVSLKNLPIGKHIIKWKVFDGCANVSSCTENITVRDGKPPTLVCYIFTSANLIQEDDSIRLPARHFIKEAFDNCSPKNKLVFSFSPEKKDSFLTFDCDDLGLQFLRIYAIDEAGNSDFAYILVRIHVNEPCTFNSIKINIKDIQDQPLQNFVLSLEGAGRSYNIGITDHNGAFSIPYKENFIKPNLRFSPPESIKYLIRDTDILMLKDYLLGKTDLDEIQKFSADLNNDGTLTSNDLKLMRKYYQNPDTYTEVTNKVKFYIEDSSGNGNLKEVDFINDFKGLINIRCAIKGFL